ncbi:branched-chain amino acid aminotransferase [Thalassobaculum sp. OXR-137]|uniref:branched-chain amino acid aminotransferase n=1 Tax=Thalassobaculum sp. OXR-137 TaxID=3100173 RepID=UPI002AC93CC6|nr:branched-chain amino acid aminotransferase [Thalassobaculum sp. OXR-137]WPZ33060.1 branched-chain amino acid aminotransferase [Thalassobaculum sp. OXR-137]
MAGMYWYDGQWRNEQPLVSGPLDLAFWSGNTVFDGARAIGGCAPDLDRHCARLIRSAAAIGMACPLSAEEVHRLCIEGLEMLPADKDYYLRPMVFCSGGSILPETGDIRFTLAIFEAPMPGENAGKATMTSIRRPAPDQAPTDAKAGALYPNSQRARREAMAKGFTLGVVCDHEGNVAEFSHANLWFAKDGVAITPKPNGTFLDGITKNRVIALLTEAGIPVEQRSVTPADLDMADEIFTTGNMGKVQAVTGWEARELQPGPIFRTARELYAAHIEASRVPSAGSAYRRAVA